MCSSNDAVCSEVSDHNYLGIHATVTDDLLNVYTARQVAHMALMYRWKDVHFISFII